MLLDRLFRPKPALTAGRALYAAVVDQSRTPALYEAYAAPDTVEGRFEIYTLHVFLLLDRLKRQGPQASETAQALFDTYVSALDAALREMGVGDLSVGKKMRKLGEAFYGRVKSYETAFDSLPDIAALNALLVRTVYAEAPSGGAPKLLDYVLAQRAALADQPLDRLLTGDVAWSPA
ncbi:ubiquinol-cytochrome C chaperone family protein [Phenylobacterium sp.]|uniref:ubiquinol-cytochrome C chaperone family protein n=1 Tax=Phenylobacterium sp. TaxID=1871053 RepID=UPI0030F37292